MKVVLEHTLDSYDAMPTNAMCLQTLEHHLQPSCMEYFLNLDNCCRPIGTITEAVCRLFLMYDVAALTRAGLMRRSGWEHNTSHVAAIRLASSLRADRSQPPSGVDVCGSPSPSSQVCHGREGWMVSCGKCWMPLA